MAAGRSVVPLALALAIAACGRDRSPAPPIDVVLVTIDTLRADRVGVYGHRAAATPVLDRLAARGARFADAVAVAPLTLPSHASIMTATSPLVHGVRDNAGFTVPTSLPTLAAAFAAAGYQTGAFVSGFPLHRRFGLARGFTTYDDQFNTGGDRAARPAVERRASDTVAAAGNWIDSRGADPHPLLLWVHLFDPHAPYEPPEPYRTRFAQDPYDGEVAFADAQVGVLLERLARGRPDRETLVVATSDHGEGLGDHREPTHGLFVYDSTLRVPLIIAGPRVGAGQVVTEGVRSIDIAPTLLDLAGLPPLASAEGESLRPFLDGRGGTKAPRAAYAESLFGRLCCGWAPLQAWRDGGLVFIDAPRPELYDVVADPAQSRNIATDRPADLARLRQALDAARAREGRPSRDATSSDARARLRSLGYAGASGATRPSLRDPKDMIDVSNRIGQAVDAEDADPARAEAILREVLRTDPANPMARRRLGSALMAQRRYDQAAGVLRALIRDGDDADETALLLADAAIGAGALEEARALLDRVRRRNPDDAAVAFKLGLVLARLGKAADAVPLFSTVVEREPANVDARVDLATVLLDAGRAAEALPHFERARAMGPSTPLVLNGLGFAKLQTGDARGAADAFRESLRLDPNQPDIDTALRRALAR